MLNQIILVGKLKERKENSFLLEVQRAYKNAEGEYDTDIISINLMPHFMDNRIIQEELKRNDTIGIKGHVEEGNKIIAEKITFLSKGKDEDK